MRNYYVYILTNYTKTTLYIGVTNNIANRIVEHKTKSNKGFTNKYNTKYLIYYEECQYINDAIAREKQLKKWNRKWKERLVNEVNPEWKDLGSEWQ